MEFLEKKEGSEIKERGLQYAIPSNRKSIKEILLEEQKGFCAYSERYVQHTDQADIEHFDGRLKDTTNDGYENWYVVLSWMNSHKPKKIEPFLPILLPFNPLLKSRIRYDGGQFVEVSKDDLEAKRLVEYLGFNKYELVQDRNKHVGRLQMLQGLLAPSEFDELLRKDNFYLSYASALKVELGIDYSDYLQ